MATNQFLINHIGYPCAASKRVYYTGASDDFTVFRLHDCVFTPVLTGALQRSPVHEIKDVKTGDLSSLQRPGIYRIGSNDENSRCFVISDDAYATVPRVLLSYFTWQRCSDDLGWHGNCHRDDGILLKNGEFRNLSKGHHQSGDLRKWVWGTSIGILGLCEYALQENPLWDKGAAKAEIRHSCDYFLPLISDVGFLIGSTWIPAGFAARPNHKGFGDESINWQGRRFYEKPAPETAHWTVMRVLALASCLFAPVDAAYASRCLNGAERLWAYMNGSGSKLRDYDFPEYPPLGHDDFKKHFAGYYPGSALRHAGRAAAAIDLYRARPEAHYRNAAREALQALSALQVADNDRSASGCFYEGPGKKQLADVYNYFFYTSAPVAFAAALSQFPDDPDTHRWRQCIERIADQSCMAAQRNPFGRIPGAWSWREPSGDEPGAIVYDYFNYAYNMSLIAGGVFLAQAAILLQRTAYAEASQWQLDWILGANPFDASSVEGVGYNQPHRGLFGEFFPPTPQIPGGVVTHLLESSFYSQSYGFDCEYDMPLVGWLMYLVAAINRLKQLG